MTASVRLTLRGSLRLLSAARTVRDQHDGRKIGKHNSKGPPAEPLRKEPTSQRERSERDEGSEPLTTLCRGDVAVDDFGFKAPAMLGLEFPLLDDAVSSPRQKVFIPLQLLRGWQWPGVLSGDQLSRRRPSERITRCRHRHHLGAAPATATHLHLGPTLRGRLGLGGQQDTQIISGNLPILLQGPLISLLFSPTAVVGIEDAHQIERSAHAGHEGRLRDEKVGPSPTSRRPRSPLQEPGEEPQNPCHEVMLTPTPRFASSRRG